MVHQIQTRTVLFGCLFSLILSAGCGSGKSETVPEDELSSYLEEHPDLAEVVEDDADPAENDE